ncbi:MAG: hypothetical protein RJA10_73, partial [Pseudomonadota bacterium]
TGEALAQMVLLQSAIWDPTGMGAAITAWKAKGTAAFEPLQAVPPL